MLSIMKHKYIVKIFNLFLVFIFVFSSLAPKYAFAGRSDAGGGELPEFNFGDFAASIGMSLGTMIVGGAISSTLSAGFGDIASGAKSILGIGDQGSAILNWAANAPACGAAIPDSLANLGSVIIDGADSIGVVGDMWSSTAGFYAALETMPPELFDLSYQIGPAADIAGSIAQSIPQSTNILTNMGNAFTGYFTNNFGSLQNTAMKMLEGYEKFIVVSQLGRTIGLAGSYAGWNPSTTFLVSSVASASVGSLFDPATALGDSISKGDWQSTLAFNLNADALTMARAAVVGGLTGLASAGVTVAIDGDSIDKGHSPSVLAQVGGFLAGVTAGNFARTLVNPDFWTKQPEMVIQENEAYKKYNNNIQGVNENIDKSEVLSNVSKEYAERAQRDFQSAQDEQDPEREYYYLKSSKENWSLSDKNMASAIKLNQRAETLLSQMPESIPSRFLQVPEANTDRGIVKESRVPIEESKVKNLLNNNTPTVLGPNLASVAQSDYELGASDYASRLFEGTVIKTLDMWPQIAARSLSIAASGAFGRNDRWLGSLLSSVVEGVATPLFSSLAQAYALRPGLYFGENQIRNAIQYNEYMKQLAFQSKAGTENTRLSEEYEKYRNGEITIKELESSLNSILKENRIEEKVSLDIIAQTKESLEKQMAEGVESVEKGRAYLIAMEKGLAGMERNSTEPDKINAVKFLASATRLVEGKVKNDIRGTTTLDEAFAKVDTTKFSVLAGNFLSDAKYGLLEGVISGGASALTSKLSHNDPLVAAAFSYGASMLTGAVRGIAWYEGWEPTRDANKNLIWMDRYTLYKPEPYPGDDWWQKGISDAKYIEDMRRYEEFSKVAGYVTGKRTDWGYDQESKTFVIKEIKSMEGYELRFTDTRPSLSEAMSLSFAQTNQDFLSRAFSFGAPVGVKPENISAIAMVDYFNQLNSLAMAGRNPNWFVSGISSGFINAGSAVIRNNLLTSLASIKPIAETFNIERERLAVVRTPQGDIISSLPLTIQTLDYKPWALALQTHFYLPFPSDNYRARSTKGKSFIRESAR